MRSACRECWDPVDRDGAELCDWCAATPQQRRRRLVRDGVLALLALALMAGSLLLGAWHG